MKFIELVFYIFIFLIVFGLFTGCYGKAENPSKAINNLFSSKSGFSNIS